MINIKSKEYNLSSLFQYDLLRDILLSLSEYQNEINSEIIALKNQTKYHEMRLTNLEEKNDIKINLPDFSTTITNIEAQKNVENVNNNNEIPQKDENKNKEEEIKKEEKKEDNKAENKKELDKNKKEEKESKDNSDEEEIKFPKRKRKKIQSTKFGELINDNFIVNYSLNNSPQSQKNSELNLELIGEMMKKIRENTEKIANLETDINKLIEKQLKKTTGQFQKDIRNELLENKSNFTNLDNRINELLQKTEEHEKLIEELTVKSSNIDIYKMVQDNGDGNVDMVKILVKSLEERVFKKFEIIDLRYKQEAGELLRSRKALESLNVIAEKNEREINDLKEGERSWKEELENLKNTIDEKDKTIQKLLEGKENNQNQKIEELKNDLDEKVQEIEERIKEKLSDNIKNKQKNVSNDEKNNQQNNYNEEIINTLERKFGDLRKKTNDLDNSFKLFIKDLDINEIKKNIKDLKFELDQKITKDSLKELYNLHLSDVDEISDLRERVSTINEDSKKNSKNITVLTNKMENILGNLTTLKENKTGPQKPLLDLSKYVDIEDFVEVNKKVNRKLEKIFAELDSLRRDLTEIQMLEKSFEKIERVNRLEEDIYIQLNERKNNSLKNKNDLLKQIKALEVQIKAINEELKQKQDADSWILAKQPIKCFNCASCEANIKNEIPSEEFISWNKYPSQNKNDSNRFGRGFSHMLQMMTSDLINNIDNPANINNNHNNKDQASQEDINNRNNLINSSNNISTINDNSKYGSKIATIERSSNILMNKNFKRDIGKSSVPKNFGRMKLPKMIEVSKKLKNEESVPNFDEEKNNVNINNDSGNFSDNENRSPHIIKITKKHGNHNIIKGYINSPQRIIYNNKNLIKPVSSEKRESKLSSNDVNKNFSQTIPIP